MHVLVLTAADSLPFTASMKREPDDVCAWISITAPRGSIPYNETICMLMVRCSCYHPQSPIKPQDLQQSYKQK